MTIYAVAAQKSTACGYLFIHCNNCSINTQYILGEKQVRISQQGRGSPLVCPTQQRQPAIVQGCAQLSHRGISAWAKHSPESHSCAKSQCPLSPDEKFELKQVKLSTRKCPIFLLLSMLNKKCEKLSIENDTKVKWLLKGYKFH